MIEKNETESLDTYIYNILSRLVLLCGKPWTTVTPSLSFVVSWHWSAYSRISSWSFSFSSVPCNPTLDFKLFREISKYVLPDFEHDKWTMLKNCNMGAGRLPDGKIKFNAFFSIGTHFNQPWLWWWAWASSLFFNMKLFGQNPKE